MKRRLQTYLESYAKSVLAREVKVSSRAAYHRRLATLAPLGQGRDPQVWQRDLLRDFASNTAKQTLILARGFWQYCLELGVVKGKNPFLTCNAKNIDNLPNPPPHTDCEDCDADVKTRFIASLHERPNTPEHPDPERPDIWTPQEIESIIAKAPNEATRDFWKLCAYEGMRHQTAADIVLGGDYNPPLSRHPSQRCRDLQRVAPGGSFNKFRVSFAWNLLHGDAPVPVQTVAQRMGLKSIKSLEGLL
jgi:hypothetical protein